MHVHRRKVPTPQKISYFEGNNPQPKISSLSQTVVIAAEPQTLKQNLMFEAKKRRK